MRLLPLHEERLEALARDPLGELQILASNGVVAAEFLTPLFAHALDFHRRANLQAPWFGYLGLTGEPVQLVGVCSFKGPPNAEGEVEIAYCTIDRYEGRGYATAMARALVEQAFAAAEVRKVIAHTLPQPSPSTSVLQKTGLTLIGEVMDPEDGRVWRWELTHRA